ncbi:MAG TPA: methyltransferase domain-containing protein [Streptosporangiaceae bacterium]
MVTGSSGTEAVRDLYEQLTDLMAEAMGGYLHGGYFGGPDPADTIGEAAGRLTDLVAGRCRLTAGQRVLDVGSGNGKASLRVAAAHRVRVTGITLSGYQVRLSRELAQEQAMIQVADFHVANMHDMPFGDGTFDAAFAIESFCHVTDRESAYREIGRVLRAGGLVAVADLFLRRPIVDERAKAIVEASNAAFENGPILPRQDYESAIRAAGLTVVEFTDIGDDVLPSFVTVARNMSAAKSAVQGLMSDEDFDQMTGSLERFATVAEIGYLIAVAQKPA